MKAVEVLLVEDNPGDVFIVRQTLAASSIPVHLTVAEDGEQARELLSRLDFSTDLIILDLNLPKLDGHTLLKQFRRNHAFPVVVFTCSSDPTEIDRTYELGANEYVRKPSDLDGFIEAIDEIARQWIVPGGDVPAGLTESVSEWP